MRPVADGIENVEHGGPALRLVASTRPLTAST